MSLSKSVKNTIAEQWKFLVEAKFEPTSQGSSNTTYFVDTSNNQFILKLYAATTDIAQIQYEHSLLAFLNSTDLPFAIPVPIPTSSGESFVKIDADGRSLDIALLPKLVGQPMDRRNLDRVRSAGFTLAILHDRLTKFDPQGQLAHLPFWGKLDRIHPQIRNPLTVPKLLNLGLEDQKHFSQLLDRAIEVAPHLSATLPIQTIHADYITPNILVENDRVVGILDFEFATRDLRLLDYFSSLSQFASFPWKEILFEDIIRAFSTGYRAYSSLTIAEMKAAISTWNLQRASSLVYWTGWSIEGKVSRQKVVDTVLETLQFETWLKLNQNKLIDALGWA
jgi:homoserine kinase type II